MKARLIKDIKGSVKLLCPDGSIIFASSPVLANLLLNFKNVDEFHGKDDSWRDAAMDMALYSGETLAVITDNYELVLYSSDVFSACVESSLQIDAYVSCEQYAQMHNKTKEIIKVYCREGRLPAHKVAGAWMIPKDAPYPVSPRRQRPKYCGLPAGKKTAK